MPTLRKRQYPRRLGKDASQRLAQVSCWCERSYVEIPKDLVGLTTGSCGTPECNRMAMKAEEE